MVVDSMANLEFYSALNSRFAKAFEALRKADLKNMEEGKYPIDGDNIFMLISERELKKPEDAAMEVHDKYIDVQVVLSGTESYGWKDRAQCTAPRGVMDTEKDCLFYDDKPTTYVTLQGGQFAIFFPQDGHAPLVGQGMVRKCIIKVKM